MANELTTTEGGDPRDAAEARELTTRQATEPVFQPRNLGSGAAMMNVGSVSIESERAIAEVQGKILVAQRFRRSLADCREELQVACSSLAFAETAFYAVPNRGSGPSIRFAEEVARIYGNFDYGHRELSRDTGDGTKENPGKSEVEVYAWDMEKNNFSRRQITVLHVIDTKQGSRVIRDQGEIDNRIANIASKQVRGRILALVSKALVAEGVELCKKTLAGGGDKPLAVRIQTMQTAFSTVGVTVAMLEAKLEHKLDATTIDELADMRGILVAIKEGAKVAEHFGAKEEEADAAAGGVASAKPEPKPAAKAATEKPAEAKPAEAKAEEKPAEAKAEAVAQEKAAEPDKVSTATEVAEGGAPAAEGAAAGAPAKDLF
jgi:hypothetical protein